MGSAMAQVEWLQAVLLGLLQGLTEFLPVSSTAHMDVVPQLFHQPDPGAAFSAIVQLGPIVAIIAYFRHDLGRYLGGMIRTRTPAGLASGDVDARLGWYTAFGTLPLILFGVLLEKKIDHEFRRLSVVAVSLIVLALLLLAAERLGARRKSLNRMTFADSQAIGWAQVLGLVPGASRSGVTITAGLFRGLERESAARFSFLLSIPAITAAGLYKLAKSLSHGQPGAEAAPAVLGAVVAGLFAYAVVRWFLGYMKEHNTGIFIVYRIVLGITLLGLLQMGVIHDRVKPDSSAAAGTSASSVQSQELAAAADNKTVLRHGGK